MYVTVLEIVCVSLHSMLYSFADHQSLPLVRLHICQELCAFVFVCVCVYMSHVTGLGMFVDNRVQAQYGYILRDITCKIVRFAKFPTGSQRASNDNGTRPSCELSEKQ